MNYRDRGCCSIVVGDNDEGNLLNAMRRLIPCVLVVAVVVGCAVVFVDYHNIQ